MDTDLEAVKIDESMIPKEWEEDKNMSFQEAFLMHWRNGDKSFTWNNVVYTTEREDRRTIEDAR